MVLIHKTEVQCLFRLKALNPTDCPDGGTIQ